MNKYKVHIASQVYANFTEIFENKLNYHSPSAFKFAEGFFENIDKLSIFPNRWFNLKNNLKAKLYKWCLIIYKVKNLEVQIIDIIDPREYTKSKKYL